MRLVNEQNDNQTNLEPVGFLSLLFYSLLCGLGFSSFLMSPFAVILVHRRLPDFWPKVVSIAGAVLALVVLEVPLPIVVFSFVLSVFVADNVHRQVPVWSLIFRTAVLVSFLGLLGLGIASRSFHLSDLVSVWTQFVDQVVKQAQESQLLIPEWDISTVRRLLFYQGPFYFVSGCLLSVWFSIGLAAHLKRQPEADLYSSQNLRTLRLPRAFILVALLLWLGNAASRAGAQTWLPGLSHVFLVVLSMQGTISLSIFMAQRGWKNGLRALVYIGFLLVGFYALVGLGLVAPFVFNKKKSLMECQTKPLEEAV